MFYTFKQLPIKCDSVDCEETNVIITTTDPITGEHLHHLTHKPYVVEGKGRLAVKIYFESEETRRSYLKLYRDEDRIVPEHSH